MTEPGFDDLNLNATTPRRRALQRLSAVGAGLLALTGIGGAAKDKDKKQDHPDGQQAGAAKGKRGPTGPRGPVGSTGPQGPAGNGGSGTEGPVGPTGPTGATGSDGPKGDAGAQGAPGASGVVPSGTLICNKNNANECSGYDDCPAPYTICVREGGPAGNSTNGICCRFA